MRTKKKNEKRFPQNEDFARKLIVGARHVLSIQVHLTHFPELALPGFKGEPLCVVEMATKGGMWSTVGPQFTHNSRPEWAVHTPPGSSGAGDTVNSYMYACACANSLRAQPTTQQEEWGG